MRERDRRWGRRLAAVGAISLALLGATVLPPTRAAALQDATPIVPRPAECTVEPRSLPLLTGTADVAATPAPLATATPFAPPIGEPANPETTAAVTATVREAIACRNAVDFQRAYALMTDRMLQSLFGGPETVDPVIANAIQVGPRNVPRALRLGLVAVTSVERLSDNRVGAVVTTRDATTTYVDYLFFVDDGGRWLIDEQVAIDN